MVISVCTGWVLIVTDIKGMACDHSREGEGTIRRDDRSSHHRE